MCAWTCRGGHKDRQVPELIVLYDPKCSPCGQECHLSIVTYLFTYLLTNLFTYLLTYLFIYLLTIYLLIYLLTYLFTYLLIYLLAYLLTCLFTYLLIYLLTYLFTYLLTHSLAPCSTVLEKLTGFQLVKNFPTIYGNRRFITASISARHLSLS